MGIVFGKITVEVPAHIVVHKTPHYEIWRYAPTIAATVSGGDLQLPSDATEKDFTSAAFRALARYIGVFGNPQNRAGENSEKIAMTAPVEMKTGENIAMTAPVAVTSGENDITKMQMSFFLPSQFGSISAAPVPTNNAVKLRELPRRYEAVVQFSGTLSMSSGTEMADVLLKQLREDGVQLVGEWSYCGYNPPYTLPWLKRNEVHVAVEGSRFDSVEQDVTS